MQKLLTKGIRHTKFKKVDWYYNEKIEIPHNWEWIFLDSNCKKITDGSHFSPKSVSEGKYFAAVENVKDFKIDLDSCSKISNDDYQQLVKNGCSPEKNDILFTKDGTIGKSFVFRQSQPIVLLSSIAIIRPKHSLDPDFLNYILQSQYMKKHLQVFVGGTGLRRIILKDIKKLKLPLPPLNEQKQIASILSNVDSQIAKEKLQKSNIEILKKGLMQKLLTGQIRVKF